MRVRHAKLVNVVGSPAKYGGFTIVPAEVKLNGTSFRSSFPLCDIPANQIPSVLRIPVERGFDVAWVRARFPYAFGVFPEPSEREKALLSVGFVAVADGTNDAIAFECSDYYGKTSLSFSGEETDELAIRQAADAFWGVLLSAPNELADFEAKVRHLGAPIELHFGCEDGEPCCHETLD